jgi:hydrogenase maturation protease
MKTLLLGMGNPILSDDAIGVRLARSLAPHLAHCPGLDVVEECPVGGLDLLDVLRGYDRVIVLDALATVDRVPGRWHYFDAEALRDTVHLTNVHDTNLATSLELGRRLGVPLPRGRDIHIFAVEIAEARTFSERMTDELEARLPSCTEGILERIQGLMA